MNKKTIIFSLVIFLLSVSTIVYFAIQPKNSNKNYDEFAKCLAQKKITMYGAKWCSHCLDEKKAFGNSFQYVPYVECSDDPQKCIDMNITGTPTWIFSNEKRFVGKQGLEKLSAESDCPLQSLQNQNATTTEATSTNLKN